MQYSDIKIQCYLPEYCEVWNDFTHKAKNSHFFFQRDYMEYHADRFTDYSLLFYYKDKLIAVLPANVTEGIVYSHQGLTYGGFLTPNNMTASTMILIFQALKNYLKKNEINKLIYKTIPYIFFKKPAEEDRYALYVNGAKLIQRDLSSALRIGDVSYTKGKKHNISKGKRNNLKVELQTDFTAFMQLLRIVLWNRHFAEPVHGLAEIEYLASRFPENIKLYQCFFENRLVAGTVLFINEKVVHTQYLANSDEGKNIGALDFLIDYIIKNTSATKYFSFGISTENHGQILNNGLIDYKEGFGARTIVHDIYELDI